MTHPKTNAAPAAPAQAETRADFIEEVRQRAAGISEALSSSPLARRGVALLESELRLGEPRLDERAAVREAEAAAGKERKRTPVRPIEPDPEVWIRRSESDLERERWLEGRERWIDAAENTRWGILCDRKQALGVGLYGLRKRFDGVDLGSLASLADSRWDHASLQLRARWKSEAASLEIHHATVHRGKMSERRLEHAEAMGAAEDALTRLCLLADLLDEVEHP